MAASNHNRHVSTSVIPEETLLSLTTPSGQAARSSGFNQLKSKFMGAKPSMLAPLIPPMTPVDGASAANNEGQSAANNGLQVPQTTRGAL